MLKWLPSLILLLTCSYCLGQIKEEPEARVALNSAFNLAVERMETEPELAIENLMEAMKYASSLKDTVMLAEVHRVWGTVHYYLDDDPTALQHWTKGLRFAKASGDSATITGLLNNLGNVYSNIDPDSSLRYYEEALQFHVADKDSSYTAMIYLNIAFCYYDDFGILDSSMAYTNRAQAIYEALQDEEGMAGIYAQSARIYTDLEDYKKAADYAQRAKQLSGKLGSPRLLSNALDALRYAQYGQGKFKGAYETADELILLIDSLAASENVALITEMEKEYELVKADAEIQILNAEKGKAEAEVRQQNIVILSSAIGLILLIITFISISRGKKRSDELLLNILPFETAQELKETGKAQAKKLDDVTVLFTDFKGFTFMSEQLSPERLVEEIDFCFSEFDRIIERHGIEKIKTIGDSYMAAGGVPSPIDNHAQKVVRAALDIQEFMSELAEKKKSQNEPYFEIRIGVNSGPLVAGIVGIKKFQYDIWGDTVNTASRMESAGETGKVNISESTYQLVKNEFKCEHRGKVEAKGKGEIDMYFVSVNQNSRS